MPIPFSTTFGTLPSQFDMTEEKCLRNHAYRIKVMLKVLHIDIPDPAGHFRPERAVRDTLACFV